MVQGGCIRPLHSMGLLRHPENMSELKVAAPGTDQRDELLAELRELQLRLASDLGSRHPDVGLLDRAIQHIRLTAPFADPSRFDAVLRQPF